MTIVILYTAVVWLLGFITGYEVSDFNQKINELKKKGRGNGSDVDKN